MPSDCFSSVEISMSVRTRTKIFFEISFVMFIPIFSPIIGGFLNENYDWKSINLFYSLAYPYNYLIYH